MPRYVSRPSYANVVATTALLVAVGGTAVAAVGAPSPASKPPATAAQATPKTITACSVKKGKKKGTLRIASKCRKTETKLTWLSGRVVGATGPQGAPGAAGAAGIAGVAPSGAVLHFDLPSCPAGWSPYAAAAGRTIVGTPAGGTNGAQVGTALGDQENRAVGQHSHGVTDPGHTHLADMAAQVSAGNVVPRTFQGNADLQNPGDAFDIDLPTQASVTGITVNDAGSVAGTNAPYVQLITCRKD